MATADDTTAREHIDEHIVAEAPPWVRPLAWVMRAVVRVWVIAMVVVAAAFGGISVYQYYEARRELADLRQAPGAQPYAVVAYRAELERQIEAYRNDWREWESIPQPPARPQLMYEIDLARWRNDELRREAERRRTGRPRPQFSAPQ